MSLSSNDQGPPMTPTKALWSKGETQVTGSTHTQGVPPYGAILEICPHSMSQDNPFPCAVTVEFSFPWLDPTSLLATLEVLA